MLTSIHDENTDPPGFLGVAWLNRTRERTRSATTCRTARSGEEVKGATLGLRSVYVRDNRTDSEEKKDEEKEGAKNTTRKVGERTREKGRRNGRCANA